MNKAKIKFGTDGWRAIIADDFTVENVIRVADATARWLLSKHKNSSVVVGHDCRFGGELFAETAAKVFCAHGVKVFLSKGFVSTPMISMGTKNLGANAGVIITASHNPASYNGYKLKSEFGGPLNPDSVSEVEAMIEDEVELKLLSLKEYEENGLLKYANQEVSYIEAVKKNFDIAMINSKISFAYDAMYGAGQNVIRELFPKAELLHCENNPSFGGTPPEPLHKNLLELSELIKSKGNISCGLATDGDADRIAMYDDKGNYVDAHHLLLLLIHYLHKYKNMNGKVVVAFSTSNKIKKMCGKYGLAYQVTKIGFKYICEIMVNENVLVGGEESGGIAVAGHIPERDGIWDGLTLIEFMAKTGKTLSQLIQEVYEVVGAFAYDRNDLHLEESKKLDVVKKCESGYFKKFGNYEVTNVESIDGYKFYFGADRTIMVRASGTEPLLRVYAEAPTRDEVNSMLQIAVNTLLNG